MVVGEEARSLLTGVCVVVSPLILVLWVLPEAVEIVGKATMLTMLSYVNCVEGSRDQIFWRGKIWHDNPG